jgi:hypothetical protein
VDASQRLARIKRPADTSAWSDLLGQLLSLHQPEIGELLELILAGAFRVEEQIT